jgi:hypothetical protein
VTGTARFVSQLGHKALGVDAEPSDQFWSIAKTMSGVRSHQNERLPLLQISPLVIAVRCLRWANRRFSFRERQRFNGRLTVL